MAVKSGPERRYRKGISMVKLAEMFPDEQAAVEEVGVGHLS